MKEKNFISGDLTDFIVLAVLNEKGDCYIYDIYNYIIDKSNNSIVISEGIIYTSIFKLEGNEMVSQYDVQIGRKKKRICYRLEPEGRKYYAELFRDYKKAFSNIEKFVNSFDVPELES